ncbi:ribonuclease H-like domain-containing protein [Tanacetum coccineum]|uniref:Ribonuclease H-like domain-containing protein n=1 Tax=Tanacetum coccineum TaxID=301880 RepID=A0ABQ5F4W2_9ASTR
MQKAVLKQQFEAFTISSLEGLEKGYDIFQQLLSQLKAHGAEVSNEDANHKFLRSLPPAWSNLVMIMRTKPDVDTLSIDDLYNNLRVFEQELTSTSKSSASAQNVAFVSHSKSNTNKVKSGHTGAYSTYTPSTSSNNILEREVPAGFADEVIYSLFAKQSEDLDLLHEDLEQIDDMDIEEMDINWQIAMIAIRMKKFYKKTGRRVRIDGNKPVGFDKKKLECFKCHNTGHFARECPSKGTNDGKKRDSFYQDQGAGKKEQNQNCLLTMDDGVVNWGEHTESCENGALLLRPLAGYNWRRTRPYSNYNSGSNFVRTDHSTQNIRTEDNGTEFKNRDMLEFCGNKGIKQEYSNARTPQQNGVAERMNMTLIEAARTMLADSLLPTTFWAEAVSTACYIFKNQTNPHAGTSEVTNSAGTLQTPHANVSEEEDEAEELIVVPTAVKHTAAKVGPRKSSTNSKAEEFFDRAFKSLKPKRNDGKYLRNKAPVLKSVNYGSGQDNTQPADQDDSVILELTIFNKPKKGIFDEASYDDEGIVTCLQQLTNITAC